MIHMNILLSNVCMAILDSCHLPQAAWVNCQAPLLARYDMVDSTPPEWIQAYEDERLFSVQDMWLFLSRSYTIWLFNIAMENPHAINM